MRKAAARKKMLPAAVQYGGREHVYWFGVMVLRWSLPAVSPDF